MNDISPKEASEILSHYTNLGYGIIIEGDDVSKIIQALSLASKTLSNGTPYNEADVWRKSNELLKKRLTYLGNPRGDLISREAFRKHYCKINCGERQCVDHADRCSFIDELMQFKTEPERPQGKWELHGMIYYCSECGHDCGESGDNFCGNCGADMRTKENLNG